MPPIPQSIDWPGRHAILFVHGVGNARPGDYDELVSSVRTLLGDAADTVAFYELYYDVFNDWMTEKLPLADGISALTAAIRDDFGSDDLAQLAAEMAGDVIWPVLHLAPRTVIRDAYLAQLKQIVRDGIRAGISPWSQRISIICHSLGCFHTYEALHAAANDPAHALRPLSNGVTFENVVYMASPAQLIRSVASRIRLLVPNADDLAVLRGDQLARPGQQSVTGYFEPSVKRWVSISGELDPVCGYVMRNRIDRCWMHVDGQETIVDEQLLFNVSSKLELMHLFRDALGQGGSLAMAPNNPHSWQGYIDRHAPRLREWLIP